MTCAALRAWSWVFQASQHREMVSAGAVARRNHSLGKIAVSGDAPAGSRPLALDPPSEPGSTALSAQTAARPVALDPVPWETAPEPGPGGLPRPRCASWGSGLEPPSPPCLDVILAPKNPPKSGPFWAEFLRVFWACGATSRGGGGAPPTTLILLRNQRRRPRPGERRRCAPFGVVSRVPGGSRRPARPNSGGKKEGKNCPWRGVGGGGGFGVCRRGVRRLPAGVCPTAGVRYRFPRLCPDSGGP